MSPINSHRQLPKHLTRLSRAATSVLAAALLATSACANVVHLAANGIGQVLIFPYYTTRAGTVSLVSLVNTTLEAKAVRINVREARRGAIVASVNLYLSAADVWTGALIDDGEGASIFSNDTSCTAPAISSSSSLKLSNAEFVNDSPTPNLARDSRDRTREGYLEVIEMAAIPNVTATGKNVTHVAGKPACAAGITGLAFEPPVADLKAATGGLMGTLSFVNVNKGMLASTPGTALDGFWLTGPAAPAPRVWAANSSDINLTSGKNTSVAHSAQGNRYISRFANSIDAVSAAMMSDTMNSEYAFTADGVIAGTMVVNMPTKPYYILTSSPAPFTRTWDGSSGKSCDDIASSSFDREEFAFAPEGGFPEPPPGLVYPSACYVANAIVPGLDSTSTPDLSLFASTLAIGKLAGQNQGLMVVTPGKEGGHIQITPTNRNAALKPLASSVLQRTSAGTFAWTPVSAALYGLPIIGFTLSQAAYQTGSPQQNYGDATPLRSTAIVITTGQ